MKKLLLSVLALVSVTVLFAQPPAGDANLGDVYGDNVTAGKNFNAKNLTGKLKEGPLETKLKAKVLEVCPNKGCWVKVQLEDKSVATIKMKGYKFFVPTSLEGKNIEVDGKVEIATTSVDELKHFAEDAKKPQEEIDAIKEPKKEIKIMANGIKVVK
ncbi:MAG: DUF4920 domain-containing protein [Ginsengibacter sp.]|jgi:hypothetical protein